MSFNYDLPLPANEWCILTHSQSSLLSVGELCNSNCTTIFKNDKAHVAQNDNNDINLNKKSSPIEKLYRLIENLIIIHMLWETTLAKSTTIITLKAMIFYLLLKSTSTTIIALKKWCPTCSKQNLVYDVSKYPHMPCNLHQIKSKYERIRHLHAACGRPVKSSFLSAIKSQFEHLAWSNMQSHM